MEAQADPTLRLIALFKLAKGTILLSLGFGIFRLLHQNVGAVIEGWLDHLRIDPDNRYAAALLSKAGLASDETIRLFSGVTFAYAAIFLTEGVGLYLRKHWAEWFTVFATGSLVPMEAYELVKHFSSIKVILLLFNLAVVCFLISRLRHSDVHGKS
jgi:uncharacterized membrane protein (DUF2068 family)